MLIENKPQKSFGWKTKNDQKLKHIKSQSFLGTIPNINAPSNLKSSLDNLFKTEIKIDSLEQLLIQLDPSIEIKLVSESVIKFESSSTNKVFEINRPQFVSNLLDMRQKGEAKFQFNTKTNSLFDNFKRNFSYV